jgi:hypothetical protein
VTNETDTASPATPLAKPAEGAALTLTLSGADLALFALVAGQLDLSGEVQLSLENIPRQPVPQALLAGLLTAAAIRLAGQPSYARASSATLRFPEQAYTDEPLHISGVRGAPDPSGALPISVSLQSGDDRLLASGVILVHAS